LLLTTEACISEVIEKPKPMPAGGGHGHGDPGGYGGDFD
jgi:hypothetical protein